MESLEARLAPATFTVLNTNDSGTGSLRQAILDANSNPGKDTIAFNIAASGVQKIALAAPLPTVTDSVIIDGTTEGGFAGTPLIVIDGTATAPGSNGLVITAGNSTVRSLAIVNFQRTINPPVVGGSGIQLMTGGGNVLTGNYLGIDADGKTAAGNWNGLIITGSANNTIGGATAGAGNVISGNHQNGFKILGPNADNNVIQGNLIGTDATGVFAVPNELGGMTVDTSAGTIIGGTSAAARNVISGNSGPGSSGLYMTNATNSKIQGNYIGVDATGAVGLSNPFAGILLSGGSGNLVGGTEPGAGNVLSDNVSSAGVVLTASMNNTVQGNLIGTDATGKVGIGNAFAGVLIGGGSTGNLIGGTTAAARNIIAANGFDPLVGPGPGVMIENPGTSNNVVQGNYIGTDITGTKALGNCLGGVVIFDAASNNIIGGSAAGAGNLIAGNAGTANGLFGDGVIIRDASQNSVLGNRIGTDPTGTAALANHGSGVLIMNAASNAIGGAEGGAGNLLSGNTAAGVRITSLLLPPALSLGQPQTTGNLPPGTYFYVLTATAATGETTPSNEIKATATASDPAVQLVWGALDHVTGYKLYRGTASGQENVLVATITNPLTTSFVDAGGATPTGAPPDINTAVGPDATLNVMQGNRIGTNASGTAALGNQNGGVLIESATTNTIGGAVAGAGNLISGNSTSPGILIKGPAADANIIQGNLIGTDVLGSKSVPNGFGGIQVINVTGTISGTIIGGTSAAARNVISGNAGPETSGVFLKGVSQSKIQGNYIGVDATGTKEMGAIFGGILILGGGNNLIGGTDPGAGNVISGNVSASGVIFTASNNNLVQGNLIGTDATGTVAIGNGENGVLISGGGELGSSSGNIIGGTSAAARNVISGNGFLAHTGAGVVITLGSSNNQVLGNYIGTDITGTKPLGNSFAGIVIRDFASNNIIGGTAAGAGNVIAASEGGAAGTFGDGILVLNAENNVVQGNRIGTNAAGAAALPNHGNGILLMSSPTNTIGGTTSAAGNLIAGNAGAGIEITSLLLPPVPHVLPTTGAGLAPGTYFYVMTSLSAVGETTASNEVSAVVTQTNGQVLIDWDPVDLATGYRIYRGTSAGNENVLVATLDGSAADFVDIGASATAGSPPRVNTAVARAANTNVVQGNFIGTDAAGTLALPNARGGVLVQSASNNTVGGTSTGAGNTIDFNSGDGVVIQSGASNAILGNSIFANNGLGIRLTDNGNNNQPAPALTSLQRSTTDSIVTGTVSGATLMNLALELFASPARPLANQGKTLLFRTNLMTNQFGTASFTLNLGVFVPFGQVVTATATDGSNNTSEFSNAVAGAVIGTGAGAGGGPQVQLFDAVSHTLLRSFFAYDPAFTGGVRIAGGDVNGDGVPDVVTAPGPGGGPDIRVFDGATGALAKQIFAFDPRFTGGVYVAVGDINGDGFGDIICGADAGGGPNVIAFSGKDFSVLLNFFAFNPLFTGGVRVAAGDVDGDGAAEIICGAGVGGGPNVTVFKGDGTIVSNFFAFDPAFTAGIYVAGADLNGTGKAQIIAGAGQGGGPNVTVFDGVTGQLLNSFFAFDPAFTGGVRVAGLPTGAGRSFILCGAGVGGGPNVRVFDSIALQQIDNFFAYDPLFTGGIYVEGR